MLQLDYTNHALPQENQHTVFSEPPYALMPASNSEDADGHSEGVYGYSSPSGLLGGSMESGVWGNDISGMSGLVSCVDVILSVSW